MAVIVKADLETVDKFAKGNAYTLVGKQKVPVYFRVLVDDFTLEDSVLAYKDDTNILVLDYVGNLGTLQDFNRGKLQGVYMVREFEFGDNIDEDDIQGMLSKVPPEVTVLIKLSESYKNMQFVQEMCRKYRNVRFSGGLLFTLEDCRLGCCDREILANRGVRVKGNKYIKTGEGCDLEYMTLAPSDILLKEKVTKTKKPSIKISPKALGDSSDKKSKKASTESKVPKEPKEPKKPTRKQQMGSLLFSGGASAL